VLILVRVKIFQTSSRICSAEQEVLAKVQEEELPENLRTGYTGRIEFKFKRCCQTHPQTFEINGKK
jgi:hypothetical protein